MDKVPHIVFQILNFLSSADSDSYNLSANEKLTLIFLSKHQGPKGLFPSFALIAKELKCSRWVVARHIKLLIKKELILMHPRKGKSAHYSINIPESPSEKLSTTRAFIDALLTTGEVIHNPCDHTVHHTRAPMIAHDQISNNKTKRERSSAKRSPSPLSLFFPDNENKRLAAELKVDIDQELISFKHRHPGKGDLQYEFSRWLEQAYEYKLQNSTRAPMRTGARVDETYAHLENWTEKRLREEEKKKFN